MNLTLRRGKLEDAKACGAICYEAFKTIAEAHQFTPDFPSVDGKRGHSGLAAKTLNVLAFTLLYL